jgi:hypothetical protein
MTTPSIDTLSNGELAEKIALKAKDLLDFTREMKEKRPEEYALFQKMFEKSVATLEATFTPDEAWVAEKKRVEDAKEAKRVEHEKKKAIKKAMEKYIEKRFNWVMKKGKEFHEQGNLSYSFKIAFLRQEEWDAEDFDKVITNHAEEAEGYLNEVKTGTDFTIHIGMCHDKCHKDGLSKKWLCEFSWEDTYNDAFAEVYDRGDEVCDDTDSDDDAE